MHGVWSGIALWHEPESRRLILSTIATDLSAIGFVIALSRGVAALWHFLTHHIWQLPQRCAVAIEQLGNEQMERRLEGIQMLNQVAKLAVKEQGAIVSTLADFVQARASIYPRGTAGMWLEVRQSEAQWSEAQTIAADIQAALTVIGHKPWIGRITWRLGHKAYGAGEPANPIEPINIGMTNLSRARLPHAYLRGINLYRTNLQWADLRNINLQKANLQKANLQDCHLHSANLQAANLQHINLQAANLHRANLQRANLYSANLGGGVLHYANLQFASLQAANLQAANLKGANLRGTFLYGANLQDTNLESVNLQGAFLAEANLQGANLCKANLRNATGLSESQLNQSRLCMTILPDGSISNRNCTEHGAQPGLGER